MKEKIDNLIKDGLLYFMGNKLPDDFYSGFIEWNEIVNKTNDPRAHYNIAYCYGSGEGIKKDIELATKHYLVALDSGIKEAATCIIRMHRNNILTGLPESIYLFKRSSINESHYVDGLKRLISLSDMLIEKGCEDVKKVKSRYFVFLSLIELHVLYAKKDFSGYKNKCRTLIEQGHDWVEQLLKIIDCHVETIVKYEEKMDVNYYEYLQDGNTHVGSTKTKYYVESKEHEFINKSDINLRVWTADFPGGISANVQSGKSIKFQHYAFNKIKSIPETYNKEEVMDIELYPLDGIIPYGEGIIPMFRLCFVLPNRIKREVKYIPFSISIGNIIGMIIFIAFLALCASQIMR